MKWAKKIWKKIKERRKDKKRFKRIIRAGPLYKLVQEYEKKRNDLLHKHKSRQNITISNLKNMFGINVRIMRGEKISVNLGKRLTGEEKQYALSHVDSC